MDQEKRLIYMNIFQYKKRTCHRKKAGFFTHSQNSLIRTIIQLLFLSVSVTLCRLYDFQSRPKL